MSQRRLNVVHGEGAPARSGRVPVSFDEFFAAESETLYRRMRLVTRNHHEAEEVVQEAFLSLYERWDRIDDVADPVAYLYRTAFNAWKKRSKRALRTLRHVFTSPETADEFDAADARTVVGEALGHLPSRQRAAIVLTELMGLSSEEAAEVLGVRPVTVRVLASQGRATLREHLGERDE
jgi:RNA polymerase sigma factor (sigma-70 family)